MLFDPENPVIKLCAQGMMLEGEAKPAEASTLFHQAWELAGNDFEKFTAAHYIARHQETVADKLKWDETALQLALKVDDPAMSGTYPSLYLNIAKCHEDMGDLIKAKENYLQALHHTSALPDDGYSNMIRAGVNKGIERMSG